MVPIFHNVAKVYFESVIYYEQGRLGLGSRILRFVNQYRFKNFVVSFEPLSSDGSILPYQNTCTYMC